MNDIPASPLTPRGRLYAWLTILGLAAMWVLALAYILALPDVTPLHFGLSGQPTRYGSKLVLGLLPPAFSIAPVVILLITRYRFRLINKHPYLVNLPAFFITYLAQLPRPRQSWWVNRYFEANLALGAAITWILALMEWGILAGAASGALSTWFTWFSLIAIFLPVVWFMVYLRRLGREMAEEVAGTNGA